MRTSSRLVIALACLLTVTVNTVLAETLFKIPWGSGPGQIGFYNKTSAGQGFEQPFSEGPGGIAVGLKNEIWVSDQWNDRILRFTRDGKLVKAVTELGGVKLSHPLCLWVREGRLVVVNRTDLTILDYDIRTKKATRLGGYGSAPGQLRQAEMIAGAGEGGVWVGDFGLSKLLLLGPDGKEKERRPWGLDGFALDDQGGMLTLEWRVGPDQRGENVVVVTDRSGKKADRFPLVAPELQAPLIIGMDSRGGVIVRFVKPGEPKRFLLVRYDANGQSGRPLGETPVSVTTQQFVVTPDGAAIGLSFDAQSAPQGAVEIVEFR